MNDSEEPTNRWLQVTRPRKKHKRGNKYKIKDCLLPTLYEYIQCGIRHHHPRTLTSISPFNRAYLSLAAVQLSKDTCPYKRRVYTAHYFADITYRIIRNIKSILGAE